MSRSSGNEYHLRTHRRVLKRLAMWAFVCGLAPASVITFLFHHIDLREA